MNDLLPSKGGQSHRSCLKKRTKWVNGYIINIHRYKNVYENQIKLENVTTSAIETFPVQIFDH